MSRRLSGQDDVGRHGNDEDGEDGGAEDDSGRDGCGHCVLPCPPELDPRCPRVETICRTRPPYGEAISGSLAARRCNEDQQGTLPKKKKKIGVQSLFLIITSFNGDIIHFGFIIIKRILTVLQHLLLLGD
jgi:hypothetical protein